MRFDQQELGNKSKQPNDCHQILIQMLQNPDWSTEVHYITIIIGAATHYQLSVITHS